MDVRLEILRLLLSTGEDLSVHEIARRLKLPPSQVFYHLRKMVEWGILIREELFDRVFYSPQKIFCVDVEATVDLLKKIGGKVEGVDDFQLANILYYFIMVHDL